MERNLLITVGDDPNYLYGVRFVASFFRNNKDLRLTLLYVAPRFESMDAGEELRHHRIDQELSAIYARVGRKALEASRDILENYGVPRGRITANLIHKEHGMASDIIEEAGRGQYHALVLGRRGYSIFEKTLHPTLPNQLVRAAIDLPIWVCRHPKRGLKDVLLCLDGSDASLAVADHVGLMTAEEEHQIHLFHVAETGEWEKVQPIMAKIEARLSGYGVGRERIATVLARSSDVADTIRQEASKGDYAVVAVGQNEPGKERSAEGRCLGSNSIKLIDTLYRSALWVCK